MFRTTFTTVKTEGGILPADLLQRIAQGRELEGLRPEDDYYLFPGERLNEAVNRAWNRCLGAWQAFDAQRARVIGPMRLASTPGYSFTAATGPSDGSDRIMIDG